MVFEFSFFKLLFFINKPFYQKSHPPPPRLLTPLTLRLKGVRSLGGGGWEIKIRSYYEFVCICIGVRGLGMSVRNIGIRVLTRKVSARLFDDLLTEVAEIVYSSVGLLKTSVSTVTGSGEGTSPKLSSFAKSKKKASRR